MSSSTFVVKILILTAKIPVVVPKIALFIISLLLFDHFFGLLHLFFSSLASSVLCSALFLASLPSGLFLIFSGCSPCFVLSIKLLLLEFIQVSMLFLLLLAEGLECLALIIELFRLDFLLESAQVV